jgi:hypothetical protein
LKFGAEAIFNEDDESAANKAIKYSDDALDRILDRTSAAFSTTTSAATSSAVSSKFGYNNAWQNANQNDPTSTGMLDDASDRSEDNAPGVSKTDEDFWTQLLEERMRQAKEKKQQEFGKGKRKRKQVQYAENDRSRMSDVGSMAMGDNIGPGAGNEEVSRSVEVFTEKPNLLDDSNDSPSAYKSENGAISRESETRLDSDGDMYMPSPIPHTDRDAITGMSDMDEEHMSDDDFMSDIDVSKKSKKKSKDPILLNADNGRDNAQPSENPYGLSNEAFSAIDKMLASWKGQAEPSVQATGAKSASPPKSGRSSVANLTPNENYNAALNRLNALRNDFLSPGGTDLLLRTNPPLGSFTNNMPNSALATSSESATKSVVNPLEPEKCVNDGLQSRQDLTIGDSNGIEIKRPANVSKRKWFLESLRNTNIDSEEGRRALFARSLKSSSRISSPTSSNLLNKMSTPIGTHMPPECHSLDVPKLPASLTIATLPSLSDQQSQIPPSKSRGRRRKDTKAQQKNATKDLELPISAADTRSFSIPSLHENDKITTAMPAPTVQNYKYQTQQGQQKNLSQDGSDQMKRGRGRPTKPARQRELSNESISAHPLNAGSFPQKLHDLLPALDPHLRTVAHTELAKKAIAVIKRTRRDRKNILNAGTDSAFFGGTDLAEDSILEEVALESDEVPDKNSTLSIGQNNTDDEGRLLQKRERPHNDLLLSSSSESNEPHTKKAKESLAIDTSAIHSNPTLASTLSYTSGKELLSPKAPLTPSAHLCGAIEPSSPKYVLQESNARMITLNSMPGRGAKSGITASAPLKSPKTFLLPIRPKPSALVSNVVPTPQVSERKTRGRPRKQPEVAQEKNPDHPDNKLRAILEMATKEIASTKQKRT